MLVASLLFSVVALVCAVIILIDAFKNALWKGFVGLLCGFYLLYYAFVEYQAPNKWTVVGAWIGSGVLSVVFRMMGGGLVPGSTLPTH